MTSQPLSLTLRIPAAPSEADPTLERALLLAAWELAEMERGVPAVEPCQAYA